MEKQIYGLSVGTDVNGVGYVEISGVPYFSAAQTFDCGQCFRFEEKNGGIEGVAFGKFIRIEQSGDTVRLTGINEKEYNETFMRYLGLGEDYGAIRSDIGERMGAYGDVIYKAMECASGIRILSQDPWEAVASFIVSQNNNIPRIKKIIDALSFALGKQIDASGMENHGAGGREFYSFPSAEAILEAGEEFIFSLKTGFRAKYIIDAASKWCSGEINEEDLKQIEALEDAVAYLCKVKGIGLKVASCALLFGFERHDPFPVDVWMKRVLDKYFEKDFNPATFGKYAGVAQQYLFDYERNNG
jgi:N-glycosylase/DNA lyase